MPKKQYAGAEVVLALEDLVRMIDRGIYDLSTWVAGMKYLLAPKKSKSGTGTWPRSIIPISTKMTRELKRGLRL